MEKLGALRMLALALAACATDDAVEEPLARDPDDPLALTRARGVADPYAPAELGSLGDLMAHFYDHPFVPYVVRGVVVSATPFRDLAGVPRTECGMDVVEIYKGVPPARISFETPGGGEAYQSHAARCVEGEEVIVFVGSEAGRLFAVGSDRTYVVVRTADGEHVEWGEEVSSFLRAELGGAR
jgi:hypothetical protein